MKEIKDGKDLVYEVTSSTSSQDDSKKEVYQSENPKKNVATPKNKIKEIKNKGLQQSTTPPTKKNEKSSRFRGRKTIEGLQVTRNKARLVCKGYAQVEGIDFEETFSPISRMEAIRMFLAYAFSRKIKVYQMDVKLDFLNGELEEEAYIEQPKGLCSLKKKTTSTD
eukprot:PITA_01974